MGDVLVLAVSLVAVLAWGGSVAFSLRLDSFLRFILAAYVIGWAGVVLATVALSLPGVLGRTALALTLVGLGIAGLVLWLLRGRPGAPRAGSAAREALRDPVVIVLALALVPALIYLTALAFGTLPNDWDGLTYHETRALLWDQQGRIGYVPGGNDPRLNGNPPVAEIGLYLSMVLPRSERFAALPQYAAFGASVIAVAILARRAGRARPEAAYAALVFACLPVVLLHAAGIQNDLVLASFLLAAVGFLLARRNPELAVGSVALALALGTKFTAVFALPLVAAIVAVGAARGQRRRAFLACAGGVALGSGWYLLNLAETGSLDGNLGETTGQAADLSPAAVLGTLRALSFDVVDISGLWRSEILLAVVIGGVLAAIGLFREVRSRGSAPRTLLVAGLLVAAVPALLRGIEWPVRETWQRTWLELGQEEVALAHDGAWTVLSLPDTSLSWYGAAGATVIVAGGIAAVVRARRGLDSRLALVLALAPAILVAILSFAVVYDPWRGRLFIAAVGLACAAWGWTLRVRWLAVGIAALSLTTAGLSLVHAYTKPSGARLFERPVLASIWERDRIGALTVARDYDGTPALLHAVEDHVPADAELAIATPIDMYLAPLAGPRLTRTLRLLRDGERVASDTSWLVSRGSVAALGCADAWATVFSEDDYDSRLLRRIRPDDCGEAVGRL